MNILKNIVHLPYCTGPFTNSPSYLASKDYPGWVLENSVSSGYRFQVMISSGFACLRFALLWAIERFEVVILNWKKLRKVCWYGWTY